MQENEVIYWLPLIIETLKSIIRKCTASCLTRISKWARPIGGDLVACRSRVREVLALSPRPANGKRIKLWQKLAGHIPETTNFTMIQNDKVQIFGLRPGPLGKKSSFTNSTCPLPLASALKFNIRKNYLIKT